MSPSDKHYGARLRAVCREWGICLEPQELSRVDPPGEVSHDIYSLPEQPPRSASASGVRTSPARNRGNEPAGKRRG